MKCPSCGRDGAYIGIIHVECCNTTCKHFDPKALDSWDEKTEPQIVVDDYEFLRRLL